MSEAGSAPLFGRRIAIPETRESERLSAMLAAQGAEVCACPLVGIVDPPDPSPMLTWLQRFITTPCDILVLYTGEGLNRLARAAGRAGTEAAFRAALGSTLILARGPKPARALRELGLRPGLRAEPATTEGLIAALAAQSLEGRRVGVQLYPDADNRLLDFVREVGAVPEPVVPYAYVPHAEDDRVVALIDAVAAGEIDAVAFTSAAQVRRIFEVAQMRGRLDRLGRGFANTTVAAVGPVVAAELRRRGVAVAAAPESAFFLKPLVRAIVAALSQA